jgi:SAM-dependent methyltransferase
VIRLGRSNLYIGGAGNRVDGYINVDLFPVAGIDVVCDAERLPFRSASFDRVDCVAVLEHTPSPAAMVSEIERCLRPGGGCFLVVPFCHPFHEYPRDYWRFSRDGLSRLVESLEVVESGWFTGPTATLLIVLIEYVKIWLPARWMKQAVWVVLGWLLFPLRYLDIVMLRLPDAGQLGNHAYLWARKRQLDDDAREPREQFP